VHASDNPTTATRRALLPPQPPPAFHRRGVGKEPVPHLHGTEAVLGEVRTPASQPEFGQDVKGVGDEGRPPVGESLLAAEHYFTAALVWAEGLLGQEPAVRPITREAFHAVAGRSPELDCANELLERGGPDSVRGRSWGRWSWAASPPRRFLPGSATRLASGRFLCRSR
jgi:hypothetical protein